MSIARGGERGAGEREGAGNRGREGEEAEGNSERKNSLEITYNSYPARTVDLDN